MFQSCAIIFRQNMSTNIKTKTKISLAILIAFFLFLSSSIAARSQTDNQVNDEITQLNNQIKQNQDKMTAIQKKQQEYSDAIKKKQAEANSLKNEMAILDNRVAKAELDMNNVQNQIDEVNLEVQKTNIEIENNKEKIAKEKQNIADILKLIYKQGDEGTLEILLMNDSLTEFLNKVKYLEDMNKGMADALDSLKSSEIDLENNKVSLDNKNEELANLKVDLEQSQAAFTQQKDTKNILLSETKNSEQQYQALLAEARRQEEAAASDIANLEKTVRAKLKNSGKPAPQLSTRGLAWPISSRTITAYFHDASYPFRNVYEHPAIDIATPQGTAIHAPADGYVARVHIDGRNYAYIMLIHGNNISTVYGHITKSLVSEDDYVSQGQVIGYTGGMPGTIGSGPFTTGPHLHFEVRKDGIPTNPLDYLP